MASSEPKERFRRRFVGAENVFFCNIADGFITDEDVVKRLSSPMLQCINAHVLNPLLACLARLVPTSYYAFVIVSLMSKQLSHPECDVTGVWATADYGLAYIVHVVHGVCKLEEPLAFGLIGEEWNDVFFQESDIPRIVGLEMLQQIRQVLSSARGDVV